MTSPQPAAAPAPFSAVDAHGRTFVLEVPTRRTALCDGCAQAILATGAAPVTAGHDCADAFHGPQWRVSDRGCSLSAAEHLIAEVHGRSAGCGCGLISLFDVLETLPAAQGQQAVDAHLDAMNRQYDHLHAVECLLDGDGAEFFIQRSCLACLTDPHTHAEDVAAEVTRLSLEWAVAARAFHVTAALGPRRPDGPVPAGVCA